MKIKSTIAAFGVMGLILTGCSSTKIQHVDAETFLKQAKVMDGMNSALSATYIGSTRDRVYLEYENYITFFQKAPVTTIYWTELDSLPKTVSEKIKTEQPPWTPFDHKKYEKEKSKYVPIDLNGDIFAEPKQ